MFHPFTWFPVFIASYFHPSQKKSIKHYRCIRHTFPMFKYPMRIASLKQSSNQDEDGLYMDSTNVDDTSADQQPRFDDEDYSKFSTESFSALKDLATASFNIILSTNTSLLNTTIAEKVWDSSKRGQALWSSDVRRWDENSTIVSMSSQLSFPILKFHFKYIFLFSLRSSGISMYVNRNLQEREELQRH